MQSGKLDTLSKPKHQTGFQVVFCNENRTTIQEYEIYCLEHTYSELDPILNEFYKYSIGFKSLTEASAKAERKHVETFLSSLGSLPDAWEGITASDIRDYVNKFLCGLCPSTIGRYMTSIRNFFRFLEYKDITINGSVLELPLAPAEWKKGAVPITLTAEEEMRLCSHYHKDTPLGNRNCLIVHLMLILGLRCSEVVNVESK